MLNFLKSNLLQRIWSSSINRYFKFLSFFVTGQLIVEFFGLLISFLTLFYWPCYIGTNQDVGYQVVLGLFGSIVLVSLLNVVNLIKEQKKFGFLYGTFKRVMFYENTHTTALTGPYARQSNYYDYVRKLIDFDHRGGGVFIGKIDYALGEAQFTLTLDPNNSTTGRGTYNYISKRDESFGYVPRALFELDYGDYTLFKYSLRKNYVVLYHKNIVPNSSTAGYEVLMSQNDFNSSLKIFQKAIRKKRKVRLRVADNLSNISSSDFTIACPLYFAISNSTGEDTIVVWRENGLNGNDPLTTYTISHISIVELTDDIFDPSRFQISHGVVQICTEVWPEYKLRPNTRT